jgi:RHS repeat-associated protein
VGSSLFGGETSQSFSYDNLYQLTSAEGSWTSRQGHQHRYDLAMGYDTIGNIKSKTQLHEKLPYEGDKWIEQQKTTYDWTYEHTAKQPHAPTKIGNRTFTYDLNGNQTGWENTQNANNRVIEWDEENRITTVSDNGHTSYYVYDAGGERTLKRSAQGETFYVNPYFVIREGQVASKHFFAGSQRVATKLTKQESQTVHGKGGNDKPAKIIYEKEQYFYHPDHLGSSSFVTDEKGEVYEHLEYFPFGETFAHEHSNTQVTPYRFTGKELDEVTGLYYYGARYYDPRTSVWQSPDPILDEYMDGKPNGGVFNPRNLHMFSYTYNNPVNLVDPNGEFTDELGAIVTGIVIIGKFVAKHAFKKMNTATSTYKAKHKIAKAQYTKVQADIASVYTMLNNEDAGHNGGKNSQDISGGTIGAALHEATTGKPTKGKWHGKKTNDALTKVRGIRKFIKGKGIVMNKRQKNLLNRQIDALQKPLEKTVEIFRNSPLVPENAKPKSRSAGKK